MGSFGDYLAGLGGQPSAAQPASAPKLTQYSYEGSPFPSYFDEKGQQVFDKNIINAYLSGQPYAPGAPGKPASLEDQIGQGFDKASGIVTRASAGAGDLLSGGYQQLLQQRKAGIAGGLSQEERALGAEMSAQRLAPDVAARLVYQPRAQAAQQAAGVAGDVGFAKAQDLASLLKGTGTELAGLTAEQLSDLVNLKIGKDAASATKQAGTVGAVGKVAATALGALL